MNILLDDTGLGGALVLDSGDLKKDNTLYTAVYLSLFNGDCYSNIFEKYETNNDFENALNLPINKNNLSCVEKCGKNALSWMQQEGIISSLNLFAFGDINNKININISLQEPSGETYSFGIIWKNEKAFLTSL